MLFILLEKGRSQFCPEKIGEVELEGTCNESKMTIFLRPIILYKCFFFLFFLFFCKNQLFFERWF